MGVQLAQNRDCKPPSQLIVAVQGRPLFLADLIDFLGKGNPPYFLSPLSPYCSGSLVEKHSRDLKCKSVHTRADPHKSRNLSSIAPGERNRVENMYKICLHTRFPSPFLLPND